MTARFWMVLVGSLAWSGLAAAGDGVRCGTLDLLDETLARPLPPLTTAPPPPSGEKIQREAHGGCANVFVTDNFAIKWGNGVSIAESDVRSLGEAFEYIWDHEIGVMDHSAPWGTDTYLMNVYIGDTGSCAPSALGMAGYYTTDPEDMPMIVMASGGLSDVGYAASTAAHEFYHALQHATGSFGADSAYWFWEATASWVEDEVYPGTSQYATFLFGYAFQPHRQLNAYSYPTTGAIEEYHQYGAFIFPRYISEHRADWSVIRDVWMESGRWDDPVQALIEAMPDEDFEALFADFAAHNASWDYEDGAAFAADLAYWSEQTQYGDYDEQVADALGEQGTHDEWQQPPSDTLPERYGYNVISLHNPADRDLVVRFEGDEAGSDGSEARYQVRLVRLMPGGTEYLTVPMDADGATGELDVGSVGGESALYLVVSAFSDAWNEGETFDYRYQLDMGEIVDVAGGGDPGPGGAAGVPDGFVKDDSGCGCSGTRTPAAVPWFLGLLGFVLTARRRR